MPPSPCTPAYPEAIGIPFSATVLFWKKGGIDPEAAERSPAVGVGFVEPACDKLARRANQFGRNRAARMSITVRRHCEERSDEAIQALLRRKKLDCFASLAMTGQGSLTFESENSLRTCRRDSSCIPDCRRRLPAQQSGHDTDLACPIERRSAVAQSAPRPGRRRARSAGDIGCGRSPAGPTLKAGRSGGADCTASGPGRVPEGGAAAGMAGIVALRLMGKLAGATYWPLMKKPIGLHDFLLSI
jgi:hypothetical protein